METLGRDPSAVETTPRLRALIDYVVKLTAEPSGMTEADVAGLRAVGYSDPAILAIVQIAGFFNWVNRTVDGLGVELEG